MSVAGAAYAIRPADASAVARIRPRADAPGRAPYTAASVADGIVGALRVLTSVAAGALRRDAPDDGSAPQPGDALVPDPVWGYHLSIAVAAPPERVWPWIVQIGADRGGFYSYEALENLFGCGLTNATRINAAWAHAPGTGLYLHPSIPPFVCVCAEAPSLLVFHAPRDAAAEAAGRPWIEASWAFSVTAAGDGTRLTSRFRQGASRDARGRPFVAAWPLKRVAVVMDARALRGIRERAERAA